MNASETLLDWVIQNVALHHGPDCRAGRARCTCGFAAAWQRWLEAQHAIAAASAK